MPVTTIESKKAAGFFKLYFIQAYSLRVQSSEVQVSRVNGERYQAPGTGFLVTVQRLKVGPVLASRTKGEASAPADAGGH